MVKKYNVVSLVLLALSVILFVIFSLCIFFGGQKLGGAIYIVYLTTMLAFAFLDRKYASNFVHFYRYSSYITGAFNILATASLIYYNVYQPLMIAACSLVGVGLIIDLFSKNRFEKRRLGSILVGIFNCALMVCVFPFFFQDTLSLGLAVMSVVLAGAIAITKFALALAPCILTLDDGKDKEKPDLADEISQSQEQSIE